MQTKRQTGGFTILSKALLVRIRYNYPIVNNSSHQLNEGSVDFVDGVIQIQKRTL